MIFSLDVLPARKGDCLLLHYGTTPQPRLIAIDGGPASVYQPFLKPRLEQVRSGRALKKDEPLPVDAFLVSHVDDDHIKGILECTTELRAAKTARRPLPFRVRDLWHNSFDKILKTKPDQLASTGQFGVAAMQVLSEEEPSSDDDELAAAKVLASIPQGFQLRTDADFFGWPVNAAFQDELIMATSGPKTAVLDGALRLTVVGPMQQELAALQKKHDKWVRRQREAREDAALAAYRDPSVPNLSSIVLVAEVNGKTMLLTGDARGDKILEGLELTKLVAEGKELSVDILKMPHHGSAHNVEIDFFKRVRANHYVLSGNGEHGNPERETLEMLCAARDHDDYSLHFTYPIPQIDKNRETDWNKEREKAKKRGVSRPAWSDERNSLSAFLKKANIPNRKQQLQVVTEGSPHLIELGDALQY